MDFTPTEATADLTALTADITARICGTEHVARLESEAAPIDDRLWRELGDAGLLALAAPSSVCDGGADLTTMETTAVAATLGRALARVPYVQHAVAAVPLIAAHGGADLREKLLAQACSGDAIVTAAVEEDVAFDLLAPATAFGAGTVSGTKVNVPYASAATAFLVIAAGADGPVAVIVDAAADGVSITETRSTGLGPTAIVAFDSAPAQALDGGADTAARARDLLRLGVAADQSGVVDGALGATAAYARDREQFGRAIGSFQAVSQRLADDYIDVQALTLTVAQAAWLLSGEVDTDPQEAARAVDTAKFWSAEAGHRVAHTTVHVHGGVGLDTSHPVHRFFLRAKQNEYTYGAASAVLTELGDAIAASS